MTALAVETAFDLEAIASMGMAFEKACRSLGNGKQAPLVKEVIAKRIIDAASHGERNPDRLCERALMALGIRIASEGRGTNRATPLVACNSFARDAV